MNAWPRTSARAWKLALAAPKADMSITGRHPGAWKGPRRFIRAKLADRPREATVLVLMMAACVRPSSPAGPALARQAELDRRMAEAGGMAPRPDSQPPALMASTSSCWSSTCRSSSSPWPRSATSSPAPSAAGRPRRRPGSRGLAFLAAAPAMLFQGLLAVSPGPACKLTLVGAADALAFLWLWLSMLIEAES